MAAVVGVILLTIFAWAWAVRRPVPLDNASTQTAPTPTESPPLVYAAIGASDVVGVGADDPVSQSWVNLVHHYMPEGTRFVRLARSGITLHQANEVELPLAVAAQPDVVTLWNCVNDALQGVSLPTYLQDLNVTLSRLVKETKARVVLLNMPDITILMNQADPAQRDLIRGGIVQWNKAMSETAAAYGDRVAIVDLFPISAEILAHPEYISPDHFHPSTSGYRRLADVVWDAIKRDRLLER